MREHADDELSMDELDAVAGGVDRRNWYTQGCAATVEPGSSCWGTDGGCTYVNISYWSMPGWQSCIYCGAKFTYTYNYGTSGGGKEFEYACRECKRWFTYNKRHGQWEEVKPRW